LKIEEKSWSAKGRCSALKLKEATRGSMMVLLWKDLSSVLVSSKGCKLQHRDSRLLSVKFSALTFNLLALVWWDRITVVVRMGTMPIGVQGSSQLRLQL
jgi:hypothetical protein